MTDQHDDRILRWKQEIEAAIAAGDYTLARQIANWAHGAAMVSHPDSDERKKYIELRDFGFRRVQDDISRRVMTEENK